MANSNIDIKLRHFRRYFIPRLLKGLVWGGMILGWYLILTLFIDTPSEHKLRHSTDNLKSEYEELSAHYNELDEVITNISDRDINVFRKLFESNPYDLGAADKRKQQELYEELVNMDNTTLLARLNNDITDVGHSLDRFNKSYDMLCQIAESGNIEHDNIPAIQPINNKQLTLLAAGKKTLINPFHRIEREHHGVDYLIPEGTPIFATANGTIETLINSNTAHGKSITINHGNGYKTTYGHLSEIRVKNGASVKRGDIIALSGNSGLSFAPHLHYEVIFNGTRVDPIHYFFMELSPEEYKRIKQIAISSMQSFD
jgi:hypothetical protein